jgi:hypothetical protein
LEVGLASPSINIGDPSPRAALAQGFFSFAAWMGIDTSGRADLSSYVDADLIPAENVDAVSWCVYSKIIVGRPNGVLAMTDESSRAEMAAIITRFLALVE